MPTIKDRLSLALDESPDKTQADLARACGVARSSVNAWLSGKAKGLKPSNLVAASRYLNVRIEWLATGELPMRGGEPLKEDKQSVINAATQSGAWVNTDTGPLIVSQAPLLSWASAAAWSEGKQVENIGLVSVTTRIGTRGFALKVQGDSMEPEFTAGSVIVVDPDHPAEHGDYVVAKVDGADSITFKQLVIEGTDKYLRPINPRYPVLEFCPLTKIIGVVRQVSKIFS